MAEAVLKHQIAERASLKGKYDFKIDSAGTGAYHAGDSADERCVYLSICILPPHLEPSLVRDGPFKRVSWEGRENM